MRISVPCRGHHSLMEVFFIFFGPKEDQVPQRNPKAAKPKPPLSMTYRKDSFTVRGAARSPIEYLCWDSSIWTSEFVLNSWSNSPCIDRSRPSTESYWIYRTYTYSPRIWVNGNLAAHASFVWSDWRYESPNSCEPKRCTDGLNPVSSQSTQPIDRSTSRNWSPKCQCHHARPHILQTAPVASPPQICQLFFQRGLTSHARVKRCSANALAIRGWKNQSQGTDFITMGCICQSKEMQWHHEMDTTNFQYLLLDTCNTSMHRSVPFCLWTFKIGQSGSLLATTNAHLSMLWNNIAASSWLCTHWLFPWPLWKRLWLRVVCSKSAGSILQAPYRRSRSNLMSIVGFNPHRSGPVSNMIHLADMRKTHCSQILINIIYCKSCLARSWHSFASCFNHFNHFNHRVVVRAITAVPFVTHLDIEDVRFLLE